MPGRRSSIHTVAIARHLLAEVRAYRGWSAPEVDARAGVPAGTCQRYEETFEAARSVSALAQLARLLGIRVADLISPTGSAADCVKGQCGSVVRDWRYASGFSLAAVAKACKLTVGEYLEIERGDSAVELYVPDLFRLAECLDIPLYDLLEPV